jgi:hypothetical protein
MRDWVDLRPFWVEADGHARAGAALLVLVVRLPCEHCAHRGKRACLPLSSSRNNARSNRLLTRPKRKTGIK